MGQKPQQKPHLLQKKSQKRRRVYKQHVANSRPAPSIPKKISDFNRFLRFFGRQIQRPVFPIHENRRKFNLKGKKPKAFHPLVLTKAENIAGYEKFTLDEVIYPDEKKEKEPEVKERSDNEDDIALVDTKEAVEEKKVEEPLVKKVDVR